MIDLTKPGGIIFLVIAFITLVGFLYSLVSFIRWQIRYLKNGEFDLPPFAFVGAVVIGGLIVAGIIYSVLYIGGVKFAHSIGEAVNNIKIEMQP